MSNRSPAPETVIRRIVEAILRNDVVTTEVGVIESYDADTCTASVQPLVMRVVQTENGLQTVRQSVVDDAPVAFLGGGDGRLTFPIARGDECILLAASRSLDRWSAFGGEVDPQDRRHHHITDSIVLVTPKLSPSANSPAHATATVLESSDLRLGDDSGSALSLKSDAQGFFDILDAWVTVPTDGGAALKTLFNAYKASHPTWPVGTTKVTAK